MQTQDSSRSVSGIAVIILVMMFSATVYAFPGFYGFLHDSKGVANPHGLLDGGSDDSFYSIPDAGWVPTAASHCPPGTGVTYEEDEVLPGVISRYCQITTASPDAGTWTFTNWEIIQNGLGTPQVAMVRVAGSAASGTCNATTIMFTGSLLDGGAPWSPANHGAVSRFTSAYEIDAGPVPANGHILIARKVADTTCSPDPLRWVEIKDAGGN